MAQVLRWLWRIALLLLIAYAVRELMWQSAVLENIDANLAELLDYVDPRAAN